MTTETAPLDVRALRESFQAAAEADPQFFDSFYKRLHQTHPELWDPEHTPHFPPMGSPGMRLQTDRLGMALAETLDHLTDASYLELIYTNLGRRHQDLGALDDASVAAVGGALLATFADTLGDMWTSELAVQWSQAYFTLIEMMRAGAAEAE